MELFKHELGTVLHPDIYSGNALYGKNAMELIDECPEVEYLIYIANGPRGLHEDVSVRRANRCHLVGCLAILELDIRLNEEGGEGMLTEPTHEKIITSAVKVFKKDLPMRANMLKNLYYRAFDELGILTGLERG